MRRCSRQLVLPILIGALVSLPGLAQSGATTSTSAAPAFPKTIEYSVLFLTILQDSAEPAGAYAERRGAILDETGLGFAHQQALVDVAEGYGRKLKALFEKPPALKGKSRAEGIGEQRRVLLRSAISQLEARLGPTGVEQLESFITARIRPSIELLESSTAEGVAQ